MFLVHWAAAQVTSAGVITSADDGFTAAISHVANSGDYTLTLTNAMDPTEFIALVLPVYFGLAVLTVAIPAARLESDGVTLRINLRNVAGLPTDAGFAVVVSRLSP